MMSSNPDQSRGKGAEPLPCPWCGVDAEVDNTKDLTNVMVYCPNEECFVKPETGYFTYRADAIGKWNDRTAPAPIASVGGDETDEATLRDGIKALVKGWRDQANWEGRESGHSTRDYLRGAHDGKEAAYNRCARDTGALLESAPTAAEPVWSPEHEQEMLEHATKAMETPQPEEKMRRNFVAALLTEEIPAAEPVLGESEKASLLAHDNLHKEASSWPRWKIVQAFISERLDRK
jgi:hypothetical protein